jgi:hypothetical protein
VCVGKREGVECQGVRQGIHTQEACSVGIGVSVSVEVVGTGAGIEGGQGGSWGSWGSWGADENI